MVHIVSCSTRFCIPGSVGSRPVQLSAEINNLPKSILILVFTVITNYTPSFHSVTIKCINLPVIIYNLWKVTLRSL